jgi:hypothetical protein
MNELVVKLFGSCPLIPGINGPEPEDVLVLVLPATASCFEFRLVLIRARWAALLSVAMAPIRPTALIFAFLVLFQALDFFDSFFAPTVCLSCELCIICSFSCFRRSSTEGLDFCLFCFEEASPPRLPCLFFSLVKFLSAMSVKPSTTAGRSAFFLEAPPPMNTARFQV